MKDILNKIRRLKKDSDGQALILVAVMLAVLLGFGALTTDLGYLFVQRRNSQNLADAAALAGTWVIHKGSTYVDDIAKDYAEKYGYDREDITASIVNSKYVKASVNKQHHLFLANVLNINSVNVGAIATATRSLIWYESYKDILPLGVVRFPEVFYKVDKRKLNKGDKYYDLFNGKENPGKGNPNHELYDEFKDRPGILKDSIRDYLASLSVKYGIGTIYLKEQGNDLRYGSASDGFEYPSKELEDLLLNNIDVYKGAWEYLIEIEDSEYDVKFGGGNSENGNFGLIQLDGIQGGGTPDIVGWILNGLTEPLDDIIGESGNKVPSTEALKEYMDKRGNEAFIVGVLPKAINLSNGQIGAEANEYVILHIKNMSLSDDNPAKAILSGKVVNVFYNIDEIEPGSDNSILLPQSWLVSEP